VDEDGTVVLPTAASDPRAAALGLGCYAGIPLRRLNGELYGTLAVCDPKPRTGLAGEVEFLERLARLVTHEIGLQDALQRLVDDVGTYGPSDSEQAEADPVADLQGLGLVVEAVIRQAAKHDRDRLTRMLARETSRFAHDLVDTLMRNRTVAVLPGNVEPWGTEVDEMLERGALLLPGNQGDRIKVRSTSGAVADIPRRHLERILVNLVYRAWRVSPPPSPIGLSARLRPGAVEIAVEDHGAIVEPEDIPTMFDQDGRGLLGLSVVKELATRAGGTVRYERLANVNRIVVRLPIAGGLRALDDDTSPAPALHSVSGPRD
jgi:signal transduction histidine kinase